jgi:hypothetical protein
MRLYEVVRKSYAPQAYSEDTKTLIEYIIANCKPWMQAAYGEVAWRGVRKYKWLTRGETAPNAFVRNTRSDRVPKDSDKKLHKLYNLWIRLAGGVANRSNSIFVSGNRREAHAYGKVYAVYPIGQFNYTWSPRLDDWYSNLEQDMGLGALFNGLLKPDAKADLETVPTAASYDVAKVRELIYADKELQNALQAQHEIMVKCENAIYIEADYYANDVHTALYEYWKDNIWKQQ